MSAAEPTPQYRYERPESKRRYKHASNRDEAHFETVSGESVGKCPRGLTVEEAQALLATAVPGRPGRDGHPAQFFAVFRGVPYTTLWTRRGLSVHGFPWRFADPPGMAREVRDELRRRAVESGFGGAFDAWMKQYGRAPETRP